MKKASQLKATAPSPVVEAAVLTYTSLKMEVESLEKRKSDAKEIIEEYLKAQPDQSAEVAGWLCTLSDAKREIVKDLAKAKLKLGKALKPFLKTICYPQLRTTFKGGEKKAA